MSDDEKPSVPIAQQSPSIVDLHAVPVEFVDWIVTAGMFEEVVNVTLGAVDHSMRINDDAPARVIVVGRLRFTRAFARRLQTVLANVTDPPQNADPSSPPKPQNMLN